MYLSAVCLLWYKTSLNYNCAKSLLINKLCLYYFNWVNKKILVCSLYLCMFLCHIYRRFYKFLAEKSDSTNSFTNGIKFSRWLPIGISPRDDLIAVKLEPLGLPNKLVHNIHLIHFYFKSKNRIVFHWKDKQISFNKALHFSWLKTKDFLEQWEMQTSFHEASALSFSSVNNVLVLLTGELL